MRTKKIFFWLILFALFIYATGFFSPAHIHYTCSIELDSYTDAAKNISVVLPFPYYDPLPWFSRLKYFHTGRPVDIIAHTLKAAGAARNVQVQLVEDSKRGQALQIFIPELHHAARAMLSNKVILEFPETFPLPLFFTPAYFFKQPSEIFYLNPFRTTIYWDEKDKGFVVNKRHYTYAKVSSVEKNISVKVLFTARRRYFFGTFFVRQSMNLPENKISTETSWEKIPVSQSEGKSLW